MRSRPLGPLDPTARHTHPTWREPYSRGRRLQFCPLFKASKRRSFAALPRMRLRPSMLASTSQTGFCQAAYCAYQVEGPNQPLEEHRFDPQKVVIDPYARAIFSPALQPGRRLSSWKGAPGHADAWNVPAIWCACRVSNSTASSITTAKTLDHRRPDSCGSSY